MNGNALSRRPPHCEAIFFICFRFSRRRSRGLDLRPLHSSQIGSSFRDAKVYHFMRRCEMRSRKTCPSSSTLV